MANVQISQCFNTLKHSKKFLETMTLCQLPDTDTNVGHVNEQAHIACAVSDNWMILD